MITLIGKSLAEKGLEFQYLGPLTDCRGCKLKNVCFNLEEGKWYRITNVRDKEHECKVHYDGRVVTVEVEEIPVEMVISAKNVVEGETLAFKPLNCKEYGCEFYELCNPKGMREGTKIKVERVIGKVECPKNKDLTRVLVTW